MGLREVKKELATLSQDQLIHHIVEVYKRYPHAKEYFDFYVNPDEKVILEKYKERVHEGFYPARGRRLKLYRSRKALNEFKKLGVSPEADAELMLYFIEVGIVYAREKRPTGEAYYERLLNMLEKLLTHLVKASLLDEYNESLSHVVERAEGLPWEVQTNMSNLRNSFA